MSQCPKFKKKIMLELDSLHTNRKKGYINDQYFKLFDRFFFDQYLIYNYH